MHSASYFPGYYNVRDLIPGAISVPWPSGNGDVSARIGTGYSIPLQQFSADHYMACFKESSRQTMLKHEATFRCQVRELHRLYRRQKELMNEHQSRYIQLQMSQLDSITYPIQPNISQNVLHDPRWPNGGGPLGAVQIEQAGSSSPLKIENGEELKFLLSKTNKLGKRMLDLELPADQNVESDEEENNVVKDVKVPQIQCYPSKESHLELNSCRTSGSPSLDSTYKRRTCLFDLNEPIQLDELDMESIYQDQDLSRKSNKESEVSDGESAHINQIGEDIDGRSEIINLEERQVELLAPDLKSVQPKVFGSCESSSDQLVPRSAETKTDALHSISSKRKSKQDSRKIPETIQALPCFTMRHSKKNSATIPSFGNVSSYPSFSGDNNPSTKECSPFKRFKNSDHKKSSVDMDLNCMPPKCSSEVVAPRENYKNVDVESVSEDSVIKLSWQTKPSSDDSPLSSTYLTKPNDYESKEKEEQIDRTVTRHLRSKERDLEAPVSPENKECCPPRGESENLQLEIPPQYPKKNRHSIEELDKIAAEAIMSMSSSPTFNCLEWFARVVSSVAGNSEGDVENLLNDAADGTQKALKSHGNDENTADESLLIQHGRGRRGRQQRVLKRKALNNLGGPREAAGVALGKVTKRKRNSGENGYGKRRRPYFNIAHCNGLEQFIRSPPVRGDAKDIHLGRCLRGWGLTKGQRKARTARSCFQDFLPSADFHRLLA